MNLLLKRRSKTVAMWRIPGKETSRCKGPEVGMCLAYFRNIKEISMGLEWSERGSWRK